MYSATPQRDAEKRVRRPRATGMNRTNAIATINATETTSGFDLNAFGVEERDHA